MKKSLSFIGMGKKAGFLTVGEMGVTLDLKKRKSSLILVAEDASDNTKKKFKNMSQYRDTEILIYETKEKLGEILGKKAVSVISVNDKNFAKALLDKIEVEEKN